ncbi:MAG: autotransporter-associated beta strand repeat-containing protein [Thermoguttaceae bacterium]
MKQRLYESHFKCGIGLLAIALCLFAASTSQAAALIWDPGLTASGGGGGGGAWDGTGATLNWYDSTIPGDTGWVSGGNAEFDNTAGSVTATGVTVQNMTFNSGYTLLPASTSTLTLAGTTPTVTVNGAMVTFGTSTAGNCGPIVGTVGLTKDGAGTLYLDGRGATNTFSGGITVLNGSVQFNRDSSFGAVPGATDYNNVILKAGTTLIDNWSSTVINAFRGIRLDGTATISDVSTGTSKWLNPITGAGGLNISASTYTFQIAGGLNTYSGDTTIQSGTLSQSAALGIPYGTGKGNVYIWSSATLYNNKQSIQINGLNDGVATSHGAGTVSLDAGNSRAVTLGDNNASGNFSGAITGTQGYITKIGTGTQTLSGATNNYGLTTTNVTTVSAGTLNENGSIGGLTVQNSASFSAIGAALSSSTLNVRGALSLQAGSTDIFDINSASAYDQLNVSVGAAAGTVALGGTLQLNLNYIPAATDKFWIIQNDLSDAVTGTFAGFAEYAPVFTSGGTTWEILYDADFTTLNTNPGSGNDVVLVAIPEPAALTLLFTALAAMGGLTLVRKQRSK